MYEKSYNLEKSLDSNINKSQTSNDQQNNFDLSSIPDKTHYLCNKCLKFPYIKFCKDKSFIKLTCSCFNNKKILIKKYFQKYYLSNENSCESSFLNINKDKDKDIEERILCKEHKEKFKGFFKIIFRQLLPIMH